MFLLTATLIFISAVVYESHAEQKLECPYDSKNKDLLGVWCKKDANNQSCCTGFSFNLKAREMNDHYLSVQDNGKVFTVTVKSLPQGDGVYWCGLTDGSNIFIKLAEIKLHNPMNFVWGIMRWLFFAVLLLLVVSAHTCCSRKKAKE